MSLTIDVDIGGTFTDCVLVGPDRIVHSKTPTTGYDLSVGFRRGIEELAQQVEISPTDLLKKSDVIRYSTTLGLNALIQRTGPKLGLITTAGHEHVLAIGRSRQWADGIPVQERRQLFKMRKPEPLVPHNMVVGIRERVDCFGEVLIPIDRDDVRERVQYLVDLGAQGFVVSLLWSFLNPAHEQVVREVIQEEYPDYYLGAMPIILSSEVQPKRHEYPRTNVAILCGYLHTDMTEQFDILTDHLRGEGYKKPLFLLNNIGGVAKISRSRAIDTVGAGPVAGLMGSAFVSRVYDLPRVLVSDMGGTSFDYGLVIDGHCRSYMDWPVIDRWATESSTLEMNSIGAGGGSIAWLNQALGGRVEVGPASAGSNPGPACYDMGGTEPTVTDADLVLGYLNPANFLGGQVSLNRERSIQAMEKIARPLGVTPEEAAATVKEVVDAKMGNIIAKELALKGHSAREFVLLAHGGAGPTHATGYGTLLKVPRIMVFRHASAFCALGGATMDFRQRYEASRLITIFDPARSNPYLEDLDSFNGMVEQLMNVALRDVRGEGFESSQAIFELELDVAYARQYNMMRVQVPITSLQKPQDAQAVCDAFLRKYIDRYTELATELGSRINIHNFYLFVTVPLEKPQLPKYDFVGEDPNSAYKGGRQAYWRDLGGYVDTSTFDSDQLRPGNVIHGPAIVEAWDTTVVIPPGFRYSIDAYLTGILERE